MSLERLNEIAEADLLGRQRERAEEERQQGIRTICMLGDCPERAPLFIAEGLSIGEVGERIRRGDFGTATSPERSRDEAFRAEYRNDSYFARQGISESEYVRTRRIDEGLDNFGPIPNQTLHEIRNS